MFLPSTASTSTLAEVSFNLHFSPHHCVPASLGGTLPGFLTWLRVARIGLLLLLLPGFLGVALGGLLIGGGGGGGVVSSLVGYCPVLVGHFCSLSTGLLGLRISAPPGRLRCGGG